MPRSETFDQMKEAAIEAIAEALAMYRKAATALVKNRQKCGEAKEKIKELMHEHGRTVYVDDESGDSITLSKEEIVDIKRAKAEKADGEAE